MQGRVLVVDDDGEIRTLVSRRLRRKGYQVEEAGDGMEALAQVEVAIPDVVVTEAMPRLDGLGLLKKLRRKDSELPVIVLTGHASLDNAVTAMREGSLFDYLLKPLEDLALLEQMTGVVRQMRPVARYVLRDVTRNLREIDLESATAEVDDAEHPHSSGSPRPNGGTAR